MTTRAGVPDRGGGHDGLGRGHPGRMGSGHMMMMVPSFARTETSTAMEHHGWEDPSWQHGCALLFPEPARNVLQIGS